MRGVFERRRLRRGLHAGARIRGHVHARGDGRHPAGVPGVRRAGPGARASLRHDRPDRASGRHPIRDQRAAAALQLLRPRLPRRASPARPVPRVPAGRGGADRRPGAGRDRRGAGGAVCRARRRRACRPTGWAWATPRSTRRCSAGSVSRKQTTSRCWGRWHRETSWRSSAALEALPLEDSARELLLRVPHVRGGPEVLDELDEPLHEPVMGLRAVLELLPAAAADRVLFDFGLVRSLGYYTGAVFQVYDPAYGVPLGSGGRYDELLGPLRPRPARGRLRAERRAAAHRAHRRGARARMSGCGSPSRAGRCSPRRSTCSTTSGSTPARSVATTASCCSRRAGSSRCAHLMSRPTSRRERRTSASPARTC